MPTYTNQGGNVVGTADADSFIYTNYPEHSTVVSGLEGTDTVEVNIPSDTQHTIRVTNSFDWFGFNGLVQEGAYGPSILFYDVEDISVMGSSVNDSFELEIGPNSSGLDVNFDGAAGVDSLLFDASRRLTPLSFIVSGTSITSNFGTFANLEQFTIYGGAGDDTITTGDLHDEVRTGTGFDTIHTGAGDDRIYSLSTGGTINGGAGRDQWTGNYSDYSTALTINFGATISVSTGVVISNVEVAGAGTGSGDDVFSVTHVREGYITGGDGFDTLTYDAAATQGQQFQIMGLTDGTFRGGVDFLGGFGALGFDQFEQLNLRGDDYNDSFRLIGAFSAANIWLDGGGGVDHLDADFAYVEGGVTFVVGAGGSITSNGGQFANFERFGLGGGNSADTFVTGSGNDNLYGGGGADSLTAGAGDDVLHGGAGDDTMRGGTGNDEYYVEETGDAIIENAGEGTDLVRSQVTHRLAANVENLTLEILVALRIRRLRK